MLGGWGKRLRSKSSASLTKDVPSPPAGKENGLEAAYPIAILALFENALVLGTYALGSILIAEQKFDSLDAKEIPPKAQMRLDASRRRIAEFFGNVIIHFVLQDLQAMMSKYVKRVNEWIMS